MINSSNLRNTSRSRPKCYRKGGVVEVEQYTTKEKIERLNYSIKNVNFYLASTKKALRKEGSQQLHFNVPQNSKGIQSRHEAKEKHKKEE